MSTALPHVRRCRRTQDACPWAPHSLARVPGFICSSVGNRLQYLGRTWPLHTCPVISERKGWLPYCLTPQNGMALISPIEVTSFSFHRHLQPLQKRDDTKTGREMPPFPSVPMYPQPTPPSSGNHSSALSCCGDH